MFIWDHVPLAFPLSHVFWLSPVEVTCRHRSKISLPSLKLSPTFRGQNSKPTLYQSLVSSFVAGLFWVIIMGCHCSVLTPLWECLVTSRAVPCYHCRQQSSDWQLSSGWVVRLCLFVCVRLCRSVCVHAHWSWSRLKPSHSTVLSAIISVIKKLSVSLQN